MEYENIDEIIIEDSNTNVDDIIMDNTEQEIESTDTVVTNELVEAVLHEIAERALTTTSGEEIEEEIQEIEEEDLTDYTDILDLIESDLDIIAINTTTQSGHTIYTPISEYSLIELLLLAILSVILLKYAVEVIKNNVFKLN